MDTIEYLLEQDARAAEILIIDQTRSHEPGIAAKLQGLHDSHEIKWVMLDRPSVTRAMNTALLEAANDFVLFLDDDVIPSENLVGACLAVLGVLDEPGVWCVAGQVLQPGEKVIDEEEYSDRFFFNSSKRRFVSDVMAGNLCVDRRKAIAIGGFDENFVGVAYRFESDFARRVIASGGKIIFEPKASIRHLRISRGGTRRYGNHLTSASPMHGVGDYYFALRQGFSLKSILYILKRPFREIRTKFHLTHPWWIPVKLVGEFRAFCLAVRLFRSGPKYVGDTTTNEA